MPKCFDRSESVLTKHGYNMVKYPRADIAPLHVLGRNGQRFKWLGGIDTIWSGVVEAPAVKESPAPDFEHTSSDTHRGAMGVNILEGLLKHAGGQGGAKISRKTSLVFRYEKPTRHIIAPMELGRYLEQGELDLANPVLKAFMSLESEEASNFYVITEVLRASKLTLLVSNDDAAELSADVKALQGMGNGNISTSGASSNATSIVFNGDHPMTFAFMALELVYREGAWSILGGASPKGFLNSAEETFKPVLLSELGPLAIA